MKIAVVIPTRERPQLLSAVLMAFDQLASGAHEISYTVRCDYDVPRVEQALLDLVKVLPLGIVSHPPPLTVGHKVNEAVAAAPKSDIYVQLCDDQFPLTQNWDWEIVGASLKHQLFFWNDHIVPGAYSYPVMTRKYLNAVGGKMWPEHFPFWFADQWVDEVYELAMGKRAPIIDGLKLGGRRGKTVSARDFPFWFKFYQFLRPERIEEATKVQRAYGLPEKISEGVLKRLDLRAEFYAKDEVHESCDQVAKDLRPPSESYLACKRNAEALMLERMRA
jgi:hypothetical protein